MGWWGGRLLSKYVEYVDFHVFMVDVVFLRIVPIWNGMGR
jgi:hypothetical protein